MNSKDEALEFALDLLEKSFFSTYASLVDYLLKPTVKKLNKVISLLETNLELSAKARDIISKIPHDTKTTSITILTRAFIGLSSGMLQELRLKPEKLFDVKFKERYLEKLMKLIETCEDACELYGNPFRFYRSMLLSLAFILNNLSKKQVLKEEGSILDLKLRDILEQLIRKGEYVIPLNILQLLLAYKPPSYYDVKAYLKKIIISYLEDLGYRVLLYSPQPQGLIVIFEMPNGAVRKGVFNFGAKNVKVSFCRIPNDLDPSIKWYATPYLKEWIQRNKELVKRRLALLVDDVRGGRLTKKEYLDKIKPFKKILKEEKV